MDNTRDCLAMRLTLDPLSGRSVIERSDAVLGEAVPLAKSVAFLPYIIMLPLFENWSLSGDVRSSKLPVGIDMEIPLNEAEGCSSDCGSSSVTDPLLPVSSTLLASPEVES
jgi:hypothetical protein